MPKTLHFAGLSPSTPYFKAPRYCGLNDGDITQSGITLDVDKVTCAECRAEIFRRLGPTGSTSDTRAEITGGDPLSPEEIWKRGVEHLVAPRDQERVLAAHDRIVALRTMWALENIAARMPPAVGD